MEKSFYVDNCATSVDTDEELSRFVSGATELMQLGNFYLRGWESTSSEADSEPSHVLGLLWNRNEDFLFCDPGHFEVAELVVVNLLLEKKCCHHCKEFLIPLGLRALLLLFLKCGCKKLGGKN